jgi:hypothetical protein
VSLREVLFDCVFYLQGVLGERVNVLDKYVAEVVQEAAPEVVQEAAPEVVQEVVYGEVLFDFVP